MPVHRQPPLANPLLDLPPRTMTDAASSFCNRSLTAAR